jgi:peptidoglycan/LPS O-acetylase OafA/YrhL
MQVRYPRHYPGLDGLRGLAILLVIPCNANVVSPVISGPFRSLTVLIDRGWIGVQLFFVLSGFLITEQLYTTRHVSNYFSGFYARRILRIFPLFFGAVALGLVLMPLLGGRSYTGSEIPTWILWFGLMFINWTEPLGQGIPGFPQFWSLAVEEQFYAVWPFVVRAFASRLFTVAIVLAVLSLAIRVFMRLIGMMPAMVYMWTMCRMDALAFGAIAAVVVQRWRVKKTMPTVWPWLGSALVVALGGALCTRLYASDTWPTQTVGYTCLGVAFMLLLLGVVANDISSRRVRGLAVLRSRFIGSVGRYSYGMYVVHMFFVIFAAEWLNRIAAPFGDARMLICALVVIALSYATGFLTYHVYEKHFLRLGRRFAPVRLESADSSGG